MMFFHNRCYLDRHATAHARCLAPPAASGWDDRLAVTRDRATERRYATTRLYLRRQALLRLLPGSGQRRLVRRSRGRFAEVLGGASGEWRYGANWGGGEGAPYFVLRGENASIRVIRHVRGGDSQVIRGFDLLVHIEGDKDAVPRITDRAVEVLHELGFPEQNVWRVD